MKWYITKHTIAYHASGDNMAIAEMITTGNANKKNESIFLSVLTGFLFSIFY
jgi:hypothetical protein